MSRVVYLHVGAPKTGTTYLQDRLALNRSALAQHGVHYPLGLHASQFRAGPRPARDALGRAAGRRRRRVGQPGRPDPPARRHRDRLPRDPRRRQARAGQAGDVRARRLARCTWCTPPATWPGRSPPSGRRASSTSASRASRGFVSRVQTARRTKPTLWFWRVQSLPDVLSRWSKGLPPERVHLVTVPQAGAPARPALAALLHGLRHRPRVGAASRATARTSRSARRRPPCCASSTGGSGRPGCPRRSTAG